MNLHPHQVEARDWLLARDRGILADDMRLGKTRSAAAAALEHLPALVVCPASVKLHWAREFQALRPAVRAEVAHGLKHKFGEADVYCVNYDLLDKLKLPRFKTLIVDEAHRIKTPPGTRIKKDPKTGQKSRVPTGMRTKVCMDLMQKASRAYALTGTPMPSRPIELWPVLFALGITRLDWYGFARRYAAAWDSPWGFDVSGASNLDELQGRVAPHMLRRTKRQVFGDYVPPEFKIITFDRPVDRRETAFQREELFEHPNPLLAIEGLSELVKQSALKKIPDALEFIEDVLAEEPKVIVFGYHQEVISELKAKLKAYSPVVITGATAAEQRQPAVDKFRDDPACRVFLGNILAAGEGIDLSAADVIVFIETTWVPKDIHQAANRTESMTKLGRASSVYFLTTEASLDHYMLKRVMEKVDIIERVVKTTERTTTMTNLNHAAIAATLRQLADLFDAPAPVAEAPAEVKPVKPAKPAKAKAEAPAPEAAPKEYSEDDVRSALIAYDNAKGRGSAKKMLQETFQVAMLKDLGKEHYASVMSKVAQ